MWHRPHLMDFTFCRKAMHSLDRLAAVVDFKETDRPPVVPQIFGHAAIFNGVPLVDYLRNGETLASCQLAAQDYYGHDALFVLMDVCVESEALGSTVTYTAGQYPDVNGYALNKEMDFHTLEIPDPDTAGRMPEFLKAASILREQAPPGIPVIGCVLGPMSLACQLLSLETALYLAIDETDRFEILLDFCADVVIAFGTAQIRAGVHLPLIFDPVASPEVVPAPFFRELLAPRLKRIFTALKDGGSVFNWLHIAGQTNAIIPLYPDIGVDIANFDYCVDPRSAQLLLPNTCLDGNLKSYDFVQAIPDEIAAEASSLQRKFGDRGGFILSSGCEIPPEARPENILAMINSVRTEN